MMKQSFWQQQKAFFTPFVLMLLAIMFLVEFVKGAIIVSILPIYMQSVLGVSTFIIGWTLAMQYIGDNLFRSPIGWLIDKIGFRPVMLVGVMVTFVSVILMVVFLHYIWVVIGCALLGVGSSPLWPCVITAATEKLGASSNGSTMSVIYMSWLTGVGLGPIVINFFVGETYTTAFTILIALLTVSVIIAFFLPKQAGNGGSIRDAVALWREQQKEKRQQRGGLLQWWGRMRQYLAEARQSLHIRWVFYPALFAQTFALGLLTPVITLYARTILNLTPAQYSYFLMAGGAITVLALLPVGKMVDRWGPKWFVRIGILLSMSTLFIFTYVQSVWVILALVTLVGVGYALLIPSWNALIASVIPKEKRGAIWGFFLTIEGSGNVVGPIVSGKLWDSLSYHAPFVASGIALGVMFVLQLFIFVDRKVVVR